VGRRLGVHTRPSHARFLKFLQLHRNSMFRNAELVAVPTRSKRVGTRHLQSKMIGKETGKARPRHSLDRSDICHIRTS
jgi:hypothetical protein